MVNNKPPLRFNGFVDPWEFKKLGDVSEYRTTSLKVTDANCKGLYSLFDANSEIGFVNEQSFKNEYISIIKDGSGVGRTRKMNKNTSIVGTMGAIIPINTNIEFLYNNLQLWNFENYIIGGAIPHIYFSSYKEGIIPFPSFPEQTKIGNLFSNIDTLIENEENKYKKLLDIKKSLLNKMFPLENTYIPSIRFNGYSEKWEVKKLGEITYQSGEKNFDNLVLESYSVSNKYGFYRQDEQFKYGGIVRSADKSKSVIVTPNTFAYNPARIDVGSIGYQNLNKNVLVSPMYVVFKTFKKIANDIFLWYWLKSNLFNRIILNSQEGGVRLVFNLVKFFSSNITIPSLPEQIKIGKLFNSLDNLANLYTSKILKLKTIKQSLLNQMFI